MNYKPLFIKSRFKTIKKNYIPFFLLFFSKPQLKMSLLYCKHKHYIDFRTLTEF